MKTLFGVIETRTQTITGPLSESKSDAIEQSIRLNSAMKPGYRTYEAITVTRIS